MPESTAVGYNDAEYDPRLFSYDVSPGTYEVIFMQGVWGKSTNLFCCFMIDEETAIKLSTFARQDYQPTQSGPNMRYARKGERYRIEVGQSKTGKPTFLKAEMIHG